MAWDWKKGLGKLFGGSGIVPTHVDAPPPVKKSPVATAPSPAVVEYKAQVGGGTHREYSPAELGEIVECMRQLKDITQANLLAMQRLASATPKQGYADAQALCDRLQALKGDPYENAQNALVELNANANKLDETKNRVARNYQGDKNDAHLPVFDSERLLVIGIAQQAQAIYKVHNALVKQVREVERFVDIPEVARVSKGLAESAEIINPLIIKLCRITTQTVGCALTEAKGPGNSPTTLKL